MGTEKLHELGLLAMKITQEKLDSKIEVNAGYCTNCKKFTDEDIDHDETYLECPKCGEHTVMGIDSALEIDELEIVEDDDEDGETEE